MDLREDFKDGRFIDWPTSEKPDAIHAGLQALSVRAMEAGADMAGWLGDSKLKEECSAAALKLREYQTFRHIQQAGGRPSLS